MSAIIYYIALPFIYAISWLPFTGLYLLSDFMYFLLYKVIGYRTKIVRNNLKNAFPDKNEEEILSIQDQFYRYFCDLMLETIKTLSITPRQLKKRVLLGDMSVFEHFHERKQSVIIVMGHLGNWELAGARFSQSPYHQLFVIYHPLANRYFDRLVYHMRTRLGNKLYAMKDTIRGMLKDKNEVTATAFIADQTPQPHGAYWTTFLHQDTPVFIGPAKIAKKLKYPIVYVSVQRLKRGYYQVDGELLIEHSGDYSIEEISECHTRRLERDIVKTPEIWLWTHRRWKHKREKINLPLANVKKQGVNNSN